eukprot:638673-Prymnesium_polylepis.1
MCLRVVVGVLGGPVGRCARHVRRGERAVARWGRWTRRGAWACPCVGAARGAAERFLIGGAKDQ